MTDAERPMDPSTDDRAILLERAKRLARRPTDPGRDAFHVDVLVFSVARERFAVEARFVFAVFALSELVPLPGAYAPVVGLTRWRGDVLTVLDLRRVVGGTARALDDLTRVVVLGSSNPAFGVLADTLDGLAMIDPTTLRALPGGRALQIPGVLRGVTHDGVHVLDAAVLIAHQEGETMSAQAGTPPSSREYT